MNLQYCVNVSGMFYIWILIHHTVLSKNSSCSKNFPKWTDTDIQCYRQGQEQQMQQVGWSWQSDDRSTMESYMKKNCGKFSKLSRTSTLKNCGTTLMSDTAASHKQVKSIQKYIQLNVPYIIICLLKRVSRFCLFCKSQYELIVIGSAMTRQN